MAVGKSVSMLDSVARVTGTVPYAANLKLPDMLIGKVFRSPVPHARVTNLDISGAKQIPGVVAIVTAADFAEDGKPELMFGSSINDQSTVAGDRIRYIGEPVAVIAAETAAIAEHALELIELEYKEIPTVFDAEAAIQTGAPVIHVAHPNNCFVHSKLRRGDIDAGFAAADEIIEEEFYSPVAQPTSLEPQVAVAQWRDDKLTIWTSSQSPYTVREVLSNIFGLDLKDVRVIVPPLGGGFGGKGNVRTQPMAAALAWKVGGRPVKLVSTRAEEFVTVTKHAAKIIMKSGVKHDGTFTARQVTAHWNSGAFASSSAHLVPAGMLRAIGPYRIPTVKADSYGIYTNLPPAAAYRGAMSSQGTFAYESHMDTIAHRLGLDPLEFRMQNLLRSGDRFATGEMLQDIHFVECLQSTADGLGWDKPKLRPNNKAIKYGRGLGVMMKSTIANSTSQCRLRLDNVGQITLFTSTVEMGQGSHTALAQIAADALGVPLESISVIGPDTARTPRDAQTAASRSTYMMGNAVLDCAAVLKKKLLETATLFFEQPPEELSAASGHISAKNRSQSSISFADLLRWSALEALEATGTFSTNVGTLDPDTGQGVSTPEWHQGAGACEVAVDTETGKITVLRFHAASYAGRVVNPRLARLQNDGNVIFGLGATLYEEMVFDEGQLTNANLSDYMTPSFLDIPEELGSESLEVEGSGFHGVGEMTLPPVAPAIANAVYDAVGVQIRDLPITPEKVIKAIREEIPNN